MFNTMSTNIRRVALSLATCAVLLLPGGAFSSNAFAHDNVSFEYDCRLAGGTFNPHGSPNGNDTCTFEKCELKGEYLGKRGYPISFPMYRYYWACKVRIVENKRL